MTMTDQVPEVTNSPAEGSKDVQPPGVEAESSKSKLSRLRSVFSSRATSIRRLLPDNGNDGDKHEVDQGIHDLEDATRDAEQALDEAETEETPTETIRVEANKFIDARPNNEFFVDKPISTRRFHRRYQKDGDGDPGVEELPIYAEIVFTPKGESLQRFALAGDPTQTDNPNYKEKKLYIIPLMAEGEDGIIDILNEPIELLDQSSMAQEEDLSEEATKIETVYNEDEAQEDVDAYDEAKRENREPFLLGRQKDKVFITGTAIKGLLDVVVPSQEGLYDIHDPQRELREQAEKLPEGVDFDIEFHKGSSYKVQDSEKFVAELKDDVKGAWVIVADGLGLDKTNFPIDVVDFWAKPREDVHKVSPLKRVREFYYRRRHYNPSKDSDSDFAAATPAVAHRRARIDISVGEGGYIRKETVAHELVHIALDQEEISPNQSNAHFGKIISEGLGVLGEYLPDKVMKGKMPDAKEIHFEKNFKILEDFVKDETLTKIGINSLIPYNSANAILHWYLLDQRGGLENMRELANYSKHGFNRDTFFKAYEDVYDGKSFRELLNESKQWYQEQLALAA